MPPRSQARQSSPPSKAPTQRQAQAQQRQAATRQRRQLRTGVSAARAVQRETGGGHFAPYQAIILAEFVAAELLVSVTPIATRKNQQGLSPYEARDMSKLLALGLVYFLLELTALTGSGPARLGAWFGGLILIVVGLNEAANIAKDLDIFAPKPIQATTGAPSPPGTGTPT